MSGTALSPWASISNPDNLRRLVGEQTGCLSAVEASTDFDDYDIAPCLRSKRLEVLMAVRVPSPRFMSVWAPSPSLSTGGDISHAMERASDTFITCELMVGMTNTESYADFNANDIQYGFEEEQRNRVLRTYIRNAYVYHLNEIFSAVRNEYTDWDKPIQHPINIRDSTMEALSDGHTVAPLVRVAYLHSRRGAQTYFYHFGYQTKESDYPQVNIILYLLVYIFVNAYAKNLLRILFDAGQLLCMKSKLSCLNYFMHILIDNPFTIDSLCFW